MNSRLQNLSEEVITDWPETKDPLVTTFKSNIIKVITFNISIINVTTIKSSIIKVTTFKGNINIIKVKETLYPMFSRELRIVTSVSLSLSYYRVFFTLGLP